jgi:hypothetical protein
MPEPIEAEFVDDVTFRFDIDHQGLSLEVGAWSFSFIIKVVWDALTRGLNLLRSIWNGILDILAGRPIPAFNF